MTQKHVAGDLISNHRDDFTRCVPFRAFALDENALWVFLSESSKYWEAKCFLPIVSALKAMF